MIEITNEYRERVAFNLLEARKNYGGSDASFSKKYGIGKTIFNRIKGGEREKLLKPEKWLNIGHTLGVSPNERKWVMARTEVFDMIEEDILFCKEYSKSRMFVDKCAIGKTYSAKYLARTLKNCFYVDASQAKSKILFARTLAKCIGVNSGGNFSEVKARIKYSLNAMTTPIVIIDEAGDLDKVAFDDLKEYWNATDGSCGWYMMGAEALRNKIIKGKNNGIGSYEELFSRFSDEFSHIVPTSKDDRTNFYRNLITSVLSVNVGDEKLLRTVVNKCLTVTDGREITGLRRAESTLILNQE